MIVTLTSTLTASEFQVKTVPDDGVYPQIKLSNLRGWYAGPPLKSPTEDMPDSDGAFEPEKSNRGQKRMWLEGWLQATSVEEAEELAYDRVAAIAPLGERLHLQVESTSGIIRYMTVRVDGIPDVVPFTDRRARFQIPLVAADGRKYGDPQISGATPAGGSVDGLVFPLVNTVAIGTLDFGTFAPTGLVTLTNNGTAPTWPIFHVFGGIAVDGFQIISDQDVIEFLAAVPAGEELILDPYAGGRAVMGGVDVTGGALTRSEWPAILPGQTRTYSFDPIGSSDGNARLETEFREAWW